MNFVQCIIAANCIVIAFNCIGMMSGMKCPPTWAFVTGWITLIVIFAISTNPWMLK